MATPGKPDPAAVPPKAPQPPVKGAIMRCVFPFLLATNIFTGVYVFAKTYKRDQDKKNAETAAAAAAAAALSAPPVAVAKPAEPAPPPKRVLPPLSEDEQRQVYKWMLEEKRKSKPRDAAEKNKINEEKALLKEIIRADSLPRLW
ncbi:hypothetical protein CFC21_035343 [Triticum aestivum]|uniref:Uncharacterized protein n=3 Tax=Triticum TaxID=4564 RepID=A0A9R0RJA2_TRITD|nr:uncharacterized protein LOC119268249 [Triticum dicoccoides]XP_044340360.1 uncharacterized protein LOC123061347 isoform X2 [Triticum aestivum]KAF7022673.1 hypothetical protein CFC21_035343 [Triticum aestivum]VAH61252.1 unnamed protein product [Triticum turgidum subsp. durum]